MTTLYVPVGPPACGKSTVAAEMVNQGIIPQEAVVCPDEYRKILTGDMNNMTADGAVWQIVRDVRQTRLRRSLDVFEDATHCSPLSFARLMRDVRELDCMVGVKVIRFDVTLEDCLARNAARERKVPDDVIVRMFEGSVQVFERAEADNRVQIVDARVEADGSLTVSCGQLAARVLHCEDDPA